VSRILQLCLVLFSLCVPMLTTGCGQVLKWDRAEPMAVYSSDGEDPVLPPPADRSLVFQAFSEALHRGADTDVSKTVSMAASGYIESRNSFRIRLRMAAGVDASSLSSAQISLEAVEQGLLSAPLVTLEGSDLVIDHEALSSSTRPERFCIRVAGLIASDGVAYQSGAFGFGRLVADVNSDGVVDELDQNDIASLFGQSSIAEGAADSVIRADVDRNGAPGASDLGALLGYFGSSLPAASEGGCQ
jgi:hypothetical protein